MATWTVTYRDPDRATEDIDADDVASMDAIPGGAQRETLLLIRAGHCVFASPGDAILSLRKQQSSES